MTGRLAHKGPPRTAVAHSIGELSPLHSLLSVPGVLIVKRVLTTVENGEQGPVKLKRSLNAQSSLAPAYSNFSPGTSPDHHARPTAASYAPKA